MVLESQEQITIPEEAAIDKTATDNHVTQRNVSEVTRDAAARELPAFFYTAMEQVARDEGFTAGQYTIDTEDGSSKGDGFIGELFRAYLTEGDRREAYLCKIPPLNEARRQQFETMEIFEREVLMYNKLLPLMFAYQEAKGVSRGDGFFSIPKCYHAHYDGQSAEAIIVMEDLRLNHYSMFNKDKPVDYEHARLTMEQLGRYHAVSLAMKHDRPEQFEQFKMLDSMKESMGPEHPFIVMLQKTTRDAMETLEPHEARERNKMQKLLNGMLADVDRYANFELAEPYAVLGHGDCWINNMMYRYKVSGERSGSKISVVYVQLNRSPGFQNGTPEHIVLLDWQVARYCSPILDLAYFIFCCTDEEFRRRHYDEMMSP